MGNEEPERIGFGENIAAGNQTTLIPAAKGVN
jgi:hypothetical protein